MPRYRAGAYDKGSKTKGKFFVVDAPSAAAAILEIKKFFPGVPVSRMFANDALHTDKPDNTIHEFHPPAKRGAQ